MNARSAGTVTLPVSTITLPIWVSTGLTLTVRAVLTTTIDTVCTSGGISSERLVDSVSRLTIPVLVQSGMPVVVAVATAHGFPIQVCRGAWKSVIRNCCVSWSHPWTGRRGLSITRHSIGGHNTAVPVWARIRWAVTGIG